MGCCGTGEIKRKELPNRRRDVTIFTTKGLSLHEKVNMYDSGNGE